jgi:hypothetical protein
MQIKQLEIRDTGTFIPALAIHVVGEDGYLLRRAGYGENPCVILVNLSTMQCNYDPYDWPNRTMGVSHKAILETWDSWKDGDVVDVEFILGETTAKKQSEAVTCG